MPRRLRVYLMDRGNHLAGAVGAQPYAMADGWTEAGVMKNLGARNHQFDGATQAPRCYSRQHRLHLQRVLLAEATADKWGYDLHLVLRQAQCGGQAVADTLCVLRAFMHGELAVLPLRDRGKQLDWVVVLGGGDEARVDFYRGFRKRLVGIAGDDLGTEVL